MRGRYSLITIGLIAGVLIAVNLAAEHKAHIYVSSYPDGKNFAFTITDDPDGAKLEKIQPVYELLNSLGFKTTMACWVYEPTNLEGMPDPDEQAMSATLESDDYRGFLKQYQAKGFEIALHTVTAGSDRRDMTRLGYERFKDVFGSYPKINIMHSKNKENIYWGKNVFVSPIMRLLVGIYDRTDFSGESKDSQYFWGDICKEKTKYVRLWGTSDINTLKFNPSMPYHDNAKPYVNYWFSFSDGYTGKYFTRLLSYKNIDRLIRERGACVVYTHFSSGFCKKDESGKYEVDETVRNELVYLAKKPQGWFVPVSELLDRLADTKNIIINRHGDTISVESRNGHTVKGVTICSKSDIEFEDIGGIKIRPNEDGEILIGDIAAGEVKKFLVKTRPSFITVPEGPNFFEMNNLIFQRIKILVFEHRG